MCQVSHDVKRLYLASLKPGGKDLLLNFLVRSKRNFCHVTKHRARCRMIHVFMKYAKSHRLRPKRKHAAMKVIRNAVPASATKAKKAHSNKKSKCTAAIRKLMTYYCGKPSKYAMECRTYKAICAGKAKPKAKPKRKTVKRVSKKTVISSDITHNGQKKDSTAASVAAQANKLLGKIRL